MSLKVDKVQLEIIMKSDAARAEIIKLEDTAKALQKEMKKLKNDPAEFAKKSEEYDKVRSRIADLKKEIGLAGMTIKELQQRSKELSLQLRNMDPRTPKYKEYRDELDQVNARMKDLRGNANQTQSGFSNLANSFNKYFAITTAAIASITGVSLAFRKLAEDVAHMDDVYSDVMKTTNMSKDEVLALNESFKQMDTRTSRESLNNLARDAGKLGLEGSKNILDFVDAGNQINVALGEDLGEDAIKNIGKMVGVFEQSTKEIQGLGLKEQMLAVGSAINTLGATSSADEAYLVSFAGRLGGVAKQAGISMDAILGFGSALDQDMQQVEMSATALQNFIMKLMGEPAKFAKLAGLNVKEFTRLLNTDANAAIKQVLRAMNEKGGFQALIPVFQDMGLDGARAVGVLSSMAGSIDKIDVAQRIANKSMAEGTSITKEYNIKNNNLAAQLDKAKKEFTETALQLGESLNPALLKSTKATTYLIKGLVELPKWMKENNSSIILLTVGMIAYVISVNNARIATAAHMVEEKIKTIVQKASTAATLLQVAATGYLTGATRAANLATKAFWATLGINPFVAIAVGVTALCIGLYKLVTAQSSVSKAWKEYNTQVEVESKNSEILFTALQKTTAGTEERKRLIDKINSVYGEYLKNQLTEKSTLQDIALAQAEVNQGISEKIGLQMKEKAMNEIITKYTDDQLDKLDFIRSTLSRNLGADMSDVVMDDITSIFKSNTIDKAVGLVNKKMVELSRQYNSQAILVLQGYVNQYGKSLETMNSKLDETEKRYKGFAKKEAFEIWMPNDIHNQKKNKDKPTGSASGETEEEKKARLAAEKERAKEAKRIADSQKKERERLLNDAQLKLDIETKAHTDRLKAAGVFEKDLSKLSEDQLSERTRLEELYYTNLTKIATKSEKQRFEQAKTDAGLNVKDPSKLTGEKLKAYELLVAQHQVNLSRITEDGEKKREDFGKMVDESRLKVLTDFQESGIAALESADLRKQTMLQDALNQQLITEKEYNSEMKRLAADLAAAKLALAEASLKALETVDFKDKDVQQKALTTALAEIERLKAELVKAQGDVVKDKAKGLEKEAKTRAEQMKGIFGDSFSEIENLFTNFYTSLDNLNAGNLKSWQDWGKAIGSVVQSALAVASQVNDEYFAGKAAALEADKQRELTNAGDSAAKRELINKDYAQKELDLKKQQSSSDTNLKVFQAIAAGGLAIVQAFAQLGPIGGAVAALLIGGTTKLQIDTIKKQDAAIQATTLDSSVGGGTETKSTGARVVTQAADGRYDVIGADDGRTYRDVPYGGVARTGYVTRPTLMGERGDELVVDHGTLERLRIREPHVLRAINRNRVAQRADGNYSQIDGEAGGNGSALANYAAIIDANTAVMQKNSELLQHLITNGVKAPIVLSELQKAQALQEKSLAKGSLK